MEAEHQPEVSDGDGVTPCTDNDTALPSGAQSHDSVMKECERAYEEATNALEEALKGERDPPLFKGTHGEYEGWKRTYEELDRVKSMQTAASDAKWEARKERSRASDELLEKRRALEGSKKDKPTRLLIEAGYHQREREASEALNARSRTLVVVDKAAGAREEAHARANETLAESQRKVHIEKNSEKTVDVRPHRLTMKKCKTMHEEALNVLGEVRAGSKESLILSGEYEACEAWKQTREKLDRAKDVQTRVRNAKRKAEEVCDRVTDALVKKRRDAYEALNALLGTVFVADKAVEAQTITHLRAGNILADFKKDGEHRAKAKTTLCV